MTNAPIRTYARLPTFSAVIDGLASGLGVVTNKDEWLTEMHVYSNRIDAYSGLPPRSSLKEKLLDQLAGSNKELREVIQTRLANAEAELTNARSHALITEATEAEGLLCFVDTWAVPWIAQILADARQHPGSLLDSARQLIEIYGMSLTQEPTRSYLTFWKSEIRKAIPEGVKSSEFRSTLSKLNQFSQRKIKNIEEDLKNLRAEMQASRLSTKEIDSAINTIGGLYFAGMATMRFLSMATNIASVTVSEQELLKRVSDALIFTPDDENSTSAEVENQRLIECWSRLDLLGASAIYKDISMLDVRHNTLNPSELRATWRKKDPNGLLTSAIDFLEGNWHFYHGRLGSAKRCWKQVTKSANNQQLGETAAFAASALIALRISEGDAIKFNELNPLMCVRIDNMPQLHELVIDKIPTPFSDWSPRPSPKLNAKPNKNTHLYSLSSYDSSLIQCIVLFNSFSKSLNASTSYNPLEKLDVDIEELIKKSQKTDAKMSKAKRKVPVITGTSVKPYQLLRDIFFYRMELFGLNPENQPELPGIDSYMMLSGDDQLRVLRYVDPDQFQKDLEEHGKAEWRHPDDAQ